ncbi:malonate decarboxylase holo-ACP synthase [Cryobacterium sp. AP23]
MTHATSPHDLVYILDRRLLTAPDGTTLGPAALTAIASSVPPEDPGGWAVVRRALSDVEMVPIGIRGTNRSERFAAVVPSAQVTLVVTPEMVPLTPSAPRSSLPAFRALAAVKQDEYLQHGSDIRWGPAGSVAFELVTGQPTVTETSDLDIVITAPTPLDLDAATRFLERAGQIGCRNDVQIVTPVGAFALSEWVREGGTLVALRTKTGPQLCSDPWLAVL